MFEIVWNGGRFWQAVMMTLGHSVLTVAILAQGTTSADAGTQASICMGG